jgi:hypothetical protein
MPGWIDMHVHLEETSPTKYVEEFTQNDADVAFNSIGFAKIRSWQVLQRYAT